MPQSIPTAFFTSHSYTSRFIDLAVGQGMGLTPELAEKIQQALKPGLSPYEKPPTLLREQIAHRYRPLGYYKDNAIFAASLRTLLFHFMQQTLKEGDEVIVPVPSWPGYLSFLKRLGVNAILLNTIDNKGCVDAARLKALITEKTRLIIFSTFSNPLGSLHSEEQLSELASVMLSAKEDAPQLELLLDNIYENMLYDKVKHKTPLDFEPKLAKFSHIFSGTTKSHGIRFGFAVLASKKHAATLQETLSTTQGAIPYFNTYGAHLALDTPTPKPLIEKMKSNMALFISALTSQQGWKCAAMPAGANYVFVDIKSVMADAKIDNATEFSEMMKQEIGLSAQPGKIFGVADHYLRFALPFHASPALINIIAGRLELMTKLIRLNTSFSDVPRARL